MKRLTDWLYKVSTGWITLLATLIFLVFTITVLPRQSANAAMISEDVGTPDLSLFYTPEELYQMAEAYGEKGRDAYIQARFTFDVAWPIVYTFFLVTTISWVFQKALTHQSWLWRTNLTPILAAFFDFLENFSTSLVMFRYPDKTPIIDFLAPWFTLLKWIFVSGSFILLFIGLLLLAWNWISNRRSK
ncbi:MAG: hypothetical protein PVF74_12845 [Anaerolineales bacterium]|jgi:hypothetical protein